MEANQTTRISQYTRTLISIKANQIIGRYGLTPSDREDLEQELTLAVLEAADAWDADRGSRNTFDNRIVNRKVATIIRYRSRGCRDYHRGRMSLDDAIRNEDGGSSSRGAMMTEDTDRRRGGVDTSEERVELSKDVRSAVRSLEPDLQRLCDLLGKGTKSDAAESMGLSRTTIYKRCRAIRERFAQMGLADYVNCGVDALARDGVSDQ